MVVFPCPITQLKHMPIDPYEEPSRLRPTNRELPPIGVGIDYGTIMGPGAGGARFFGEGTVRLRRGGGGDITQFQLRSGSQAGTYSLTPGCVNNIAVLTGNLTILANSNVYIILTVTSASGVVTNGTVATNMTAPVAQTPSSNFPPTSLEIPLYKFESGKAYRIMGSRGIQLFATAIGLEPGSAPTPFVPKYAWAVIG